MQQAAVSMGSRNDATTTALDAFSLRHAAPGSVEWAAQEFRWGVAALASPGGGTRGHLQDAIGGFARALTIYTRQRNPQPWARCKVGLGAAWLMFDAEPRPDVLKSAIAAFEDALTVLTPENDGPEWSEVQTKIGHAWLELKDGDLSDHAKRAVTAFDEALRVYTFEAFPEQWAQVNMQRGRAWKNVTTHVPPGMGGETAIECFHLALKAYPRSVRPVEWANGQREIARAWCDLPTGERRENRRRAIEFLRNAGQAVDRESNGRLRRAIKYEEGQVWYSLSHDEPSESLDEAMECFEIVLESSANEPPSVEWAGAHYMLGVCSLGAPVEAFEHDPDGAIQHLETALSFYRAADYPEERAWTQCYLGAAWIELHSEERDSDLRRAIGYLDGVLQVTSPDRNLGRWATVNCHLGHAWSLLSDGGELAAIRAAKYFEAALDAWPSDKFPTEHASVINLFAAVRARGTNTPQSLEDGSKPCAA